MNLSELKIEITNRCILNCIHCSTTASIRKNKVILRSDFENFINQSVELGCKKIFLSGGEPLLHPEIKTFLKIIRKNKLESKVYSCGITQSNPIMGAGENSIKELKEAGLENMVFSLYSCNPLTHDCITRKNGSFSASLSTIQFALKNKIMTEIHFVATKRNIGELSELADLCSNIGIEKISLLRFVPQGRGKDSIDRLTPSKEDYLDLIRNIMGLRDKYPNLIFRLGSPFNFLKIGSPTPCTTGYDKMIIDVDGYAYPCDALKQITIGKSKLSNCYFSEIKTIRENGKLFNLVRNKELPKSCKGCEDQSLCQAGCLAQRLLNKKEFQSTCDPGCLKIMDHAQLPELDETFITKNCKIFSNNDFPDFLSLKSQTLLEEYLCKVKEKFSIESNFFLKLWENFLNDAITFLKSNDKREFGGSKSSKRDSIAFGITNLVEYFGQYREFEALLYGADEFYRDHIHHVFRVWLIGLWLIEKFDSNIHWDFKEFNKSEHISKNEIMAMWCIIAFTHDLGYPLDKIKKVKSKISGMMSYFGGSVTSENNFQIPSHHHFINDFILRFISSKLIRNDNSCINKSHDKFRTATQSKYYLKFSKSFENFDHGIISCILLMKNLIYFLESDFDLTNPFEEFEDARQYYIRREILRAIASHTCLEIYHLFPNTLSFILILADELQVWGRPTFAEMKEGRQKVKISVTCPIISKESIEIKLLIDNNGVDYFKNICKKWHMWLRSALDANKRNFSFIFSGITNETPPTTYKFEAHKNNVFKFSINGENKDVIKELYEES